MMRKPLLILLVSIIAAAAASKPDLWAWLSGHEDEAFAQIEANKDILTDISFGGYGLSCTDAGGCNLTDHFNATLDSRLKAAGLRRWPLVGGGSTAVLRKLFAAPEAFIAAAVHAAETRGFDGFNLDFEPYDGQATNGDGAAYGKFLTKFADALHAATPPKKLSLDFFSNDAIWNLPALNASTSDRFISMDTYIQDNHTFEAYLQVAWGHLDPSRLGVGMCTGTSKANKPYGPDPCPMTAWTQEQLDERFEFVSNEIAAKGKAAMINLWVLPLPDLWWPTLRRYYASWS